jgi:serine/threonine-protein kinase
VATKCPKCQFENTSDSKFCKECGTQLAPSEDADPSFTKTLETPVTRLAIGSIFAERYSVLEKLGKGGMGEVYRMRDEKLDEVMALKVINPEIAASQEVIERFKNELKLARKIAHKHVCKMYDLNEEEEIPYITMEYVEGEDLKTSVKKERIAVDKALKIAKQVCEGLMEAHRLGVVHRDLKPQNIMIDKEGDAKIMDFGIARSVEAPGVTVTGMVIGTPDYMSPEQVEGEEADQRSDIYSLGVVLYEMVTGRVPFEGKTPYSIALKHKSEAPKEPKVLNAQVPSDLNSVILRCMEKDREMRFQGAEGLLSELNKIEEGIPISERVEASREPVPEKISEIKWKDSIAVLPFADLSPQKDQEYFCDGLAEELINALTQIEELRVVARTSAFSFKGKDIDIREIGKKMNVNTILEGSVRKADNQLRITAQLISVADGYHLWSERYDREMNDVFAIQDDATLAIVDKLKIKLLSGDKTRLLKRSTDNMDAYNLYLKGLYFFNKRSKVGMKKGIEYFHKAIEIDPDYAAAYVGLAESFIQLGFWGFLSPKESISKAKTLAEKALRIDDSIADVHTALGFINMVYDWDWKNAERRIKLALKLNPGYALAYNRYCTYLTGMGKNDEALAAMRKAIELDPLSVRLNSELAIYYYLFGKVEESMIQIQKTLEMDPHFGQAYWMKGIVLGSKNRFKEAVSALEKAVQMTGGSATISGYLGYYYAKSGDRAKAKKIIQRLDSRSKEHYVSSTYTSIGTIYLGLEDIDKCFEYWEMAYEEHDLNLVFVDVFPEFRVLSSDPRYKGLSKRMGLIPK